MTNKERQRYPGFILEHLEFVYPGSEEAYYLDYEHEMDVITSKSFDITFDIDAAVAELKRKEAIQKNLIDFVDFLSAERESFLAGEIENIRDEIEDTVRHELLEKLKDELLDY
jgi:hypothetical protein